MKPTLAISYVRFSTVGQSDGDSVRRQTEATEAYCKKHGLVLTDAYRLKDLGKKSALGVNRSPTGALGQLEKEVEAGKIPKGTVLIVENLDRLTREDIVSAQLLLLNLIKNGIEIVALSDSERRYSKESVSANPMDLIISIMVMSRAHEESKIKSYRVKESWINRKKQAVEGKHINIRLPSWLKSEAGRYVAIPEKARVIKRIFKLYLEGYGTQTIAAMLVREKVPNIAKDVQGRSDRWHATYIQRILKAKEIIGFYTGVSPEVPHFFPAVVSESDFYAAHAKLKERYNYKGQKNNTPQPFTHLIKCVHCGEGIVKAHGNGYRYLQCQGARIKTCKPTTLPYYPTEQALLKAISSAGPTAFTVDDNAATESHKEMDALQGRISELDQKLTTATKLFIDNPSEAGTKILQQFEADKKELLQQLEDKRNSTFLVDYRADWKEVRDRIEAEIKRMGGVPYDVIPVSVQMSGGRMVFLRHTPARNEDNVIALRETLRSYIERIDMDIPGMSARIRFKTGLAIDVWFKKSNTYPRRLFYRTDKIEWTILDEQPYK